MVVAEESGVSRKSERQSKNHLPRRDQSLSFEATSKLPKAFLILVVRLIMTVKPLQGALLGLRSLNQLRTLDIDFVTPTYHRVIGERLRLAGTATDLATIDQAELIMAVVSCDVMGRSVCLHIEGRFL